MAVFTIESTSVKAESQFRPEVDSMLLFIASFSSPIGTMLLAWDDEERLRLLYFDSDETQMRHQLERAYGPCEIERRPLPALIETPLDRYFRGEITAIDSITVQAAGTAFQQEVWAALRQIPAGSTTSYGALAMKLRRPGASRAVGLANGSNPIGLVVPCHRVIGADGTLTGYGGGLPRKQWLLDHESRHAGVDAQLGLFDAAGAALVTD
jgi:methylated-DNA-[protein]-cysteine S-methyltransferase